MCASLSFPSEVVIFEENNLEFSGLYKKTTKGRLRYEIDSSVGSRYLQGAWVCDVSIVCATGCI